MASVKSAATASPFRIVKEADCSHLLLEGNVGATHARALLELARVLADARLPVRVNLGQLRHLDCAGVQVLLALDETLRQQGQAFSLESVPESAAATFRNAGLAHLC